MHTKLVEKKQEEGDSGYECASWEGHIGVDEPLQGRINWKIASECNTLICCIVAVVSAELVH